MQGYSNMSQHTINAADLLAALVRFVDAPLGFSSLCNLHTICEHLMTFDDSSFSPPQPE